MKFDDVRGIICDMDGVLWRGNTLLNGFAAFFDLLHDADLPFMLATNNSSKTPTEYVERLAGFGVTVTPEQIITSGTATRDYLQQAYPHGVALHVVGSPSLKAMLAEAGFQIVAEGADAVIVGLDKDMTYRTLMEATFNLRAKPNVRLIGTNSDKTFPGERGLQPGNGSIVAALVSASDIPPEFIGKPHAPMFHAALGHLGTTPADTLMIGDRLDTDIAGAAILGIRTALLFSGVTHHNDLIESDIQPDVAYDDLKALITAWNYTGGKRKR
ncbi:MAG: HAD-IIA family hydrolase [Phototrophicaceae bacterium]|jgi:4-nitrophenyl phosphatase